jgi:hypothetical protein
VQAFGGQPCAAQRAPDGASVHYERHRAEQTTLYRLVQEHAASFIAHTEASTGSEPPHFIRAEPGHKQSTGLLESGPDFPHCLRAPRRPEGADLARLSADTGPPLRAGLCLAKGASSASARPARP